MGTSNSYAGPNGGNPLIPSWLDAEGETEESPGSTDPNGDVDPSDDTQDQNDPKTPERDRSTEDPRRPDPKPQPDPESVTRPPEILPDRFRSARANLSRYASSGGKSRKLLGKVASGYVSKSCGGASNAAKRMGSSRGSAGRLLGFLADAQSRGLAPALESLNLGSLIGKSSEDLFIGLADYICPTEGTVDAGIARDAYVETVIDVVDAGVQSLDALTEAQVGMIFESFLTNSIFDRLCNDIGHGVVQFTKNLKDAAKVQQQIKVFISGAVRDAVSRQALDLKTISQSDAKSISVAVYRQAFSILASREEK